MLRPVEAKVSRAKAHAESLDESISLAVNGPDNLYSLVPELNLDAGECVLRVKQIGEPPIGEWAVILGEFVHNLRSALDRLAYQLAILNNPNEDPPARTEFPIFIDQEKFERADPGGGLYKIRGLSEGAQAVIKWFQPYDAPAHPLWALQQLSNGDKHRLGIDVGVEPALPIGNIRWTDLAPVHEMWERWPYKDGSVVATFAVKQTGTNPNVEVDFNPTISVSVDEGTGLPPRHIGQTIPRLLGAVQEVIAVLRWEFVRAT